MWALICGHPIWKEIIRVFQSTWICFSLIIILLVLVSLPVLCPDNFSPSTVYKYLLLCLHKPMFGSQNVHMQWLETFAGHSLLFPVINSRLAMVTWLDVLGMVLRDQEHSTITLSHFYLVVYWMSQSLGLKDQESSF